MDFTNGKESSLPMGKHYNPLEKEFLIYQYKSNKNIKMKDFCEFHGVSTGVFKHWLSQYNEGGLEGVIEIRMDEAGPVNAKDIAEKKG